MNSSPYGAGDDDDSVGDRESLSRLDGDTGYGDFEFERRFWVDNPPWVILDEPSLIVQSYFLASDGFALRLRAQATDVAVDISGVVTDQDELDLLTRHERDFDFCALTVKSPGVHGTRYEVEKEVDVSVGLELIRRGGRRIVKNRYSVWLGEDGWVIDVFGSANAPLVIAEVERSGPVTDLVIPEFCVTEVTDDTRFTNDSLSQAPFSTWVGTARDELARRGPRFLGDLGKNTFDLG